MSERHTIRKLRRLIPEMNCLSDCHDCCGPVMFSKWELSRLKDRKDFDPNSCFYLDNKKGCSIYEERPILCRLFGASEILKLKCPHDCKPKRPLNIKQTTDLMIEYLKFFPWIRDANQMVRGARIKNGKFIWEDEDASLA